MSLLVKGNDYRPGRDDILALLRSACEGKIKVGVMIDGGNPSEVTGSVNRVSPTGAVCAIHSIEVPIDRITKLWRA